MLKELLESFSFFSFFKTYYYFFLLGFFSLLKSFEATELEGCAKEQWILLITCSIHKEDCGQNFCLTSERRS